MSYRPLIVPALAPSRSVLLAASFAGCGVLLLLLFMALIGCTAFGTAVEPVGGKVIGKNDPNAFECDCDCEAAVPFTDETRITDSSDDASRAKNQTVTVLTDGQLDLGTLGNGAPNVVGLRFEHVGIPANSNIVAAFIQFTAFDNSPVGAGANLEIDAVLVPHALPFAEDTDLQTLKVTNAPVPWPAERWNAANDALPAQMTPDLRTILQPVVEQGGFTTDSSIAFIINGAITAPGRRIAKSFDESEVRGGVRIQAPKLIIQYKAPKSHQTLLVCGNAVIADAECKGRVQATVDDVANICKLADTCTCGLKPNSAAKFSEVCTHDCDRVDVPADCNPDGVAKATSTANTAPVCLGQSPLGAALFGQRSICDLNADPADPNASGSAVSFFFKDGSDSTTKLSKAQGRVEFLGNRLRCPDDKPCPHGVTHRLDLENIEVPAGVDSDTIAQLTAVGESLPGREAGLDKDGKGAFGTGAAITSGRGRNTDEQLTTAFLAPNLELVNVGLGGWKPRAACSLEGLMVGTATGKVCSAGPPRSCNTTADCAAGGGGDCNALDKYLTMFASLRGLLINQPPAADAGQDQTGDKSVECNQTGSALVTLDGSESFDPDGNIVSIGWYRGLDEEDVRTGPRIGGLPRIVTTQAVNTTTMYVLKVTDAFGQYDDATTKVAVVDKTGPTVKAPDPREAECAGAFTPVALEIVSDPPKDGDKASATDICDPSVEAVSNAAEKFPNGFPLGESTVLWTAVDDSGNKGTATQKVIIKDTVPPVLTLSLSPTVLWPPDHKLVPITATISVTDTCDPNPTVKLISITSNEPDNGLGDGDTAEDIQQAGFGTDDRTFKLRAERSGRGNGRIYTVTYQAMDASGNTSTPKTATVIVPKSQAASK